MKNCMLFVALVGLLAGCGPGAYTAQMADQSVTTTAMPISTPIQRPLVLVVPEEKVAPIVNVQNTPHSIAGFNAFVGKSMQQALTPYFTNVAVLTSAEEGPAEPHFVADITVTGVTGKPLTVGNLTYTALVMEWSMGLRPSESKEYVFSAVGEGVSDPQYRTLDMGAQQMMKSALKSLQQVWAEKEVTNALRAVDEAPAQPAEPAEPAETEAGPTAMR